MTAPNGPILFNSTTGSDSNASGLGPSVAVYGSAASTTSASAVVTGINTNGVSVGDLLWVQSSSGIQFSIIASVDSGTQVTCDQVFANTEASRTWAIGGKRATLDGTSSRNLFLNLDDLDGIVVELETNQSLTSALQIKFSPFSSTTPFTMRGSGNSLKTITQTANDYSLDLELSGRGKFEYLKFDNSNSTKNANNRVFECVLKVPVATFKNCVFGDPINTIHGVMYANTATAYMTFVQCTFQHTYDYAYSISGNLGSVWVDCLFKNCYGGVKQTSSGAGYNGGVLIRCVFSEIINEAWHNNSVHNQVGFNNLDSCIFHNCGIAVSAGVRPATISVTRCIFSGCTTVFSMTSNLVERYVIYAGVGNAYYANTTVDDGSSEIVDLHVDDITLTADPFIDAANGDFNIKSSSVLAGMNYNLDSKTTVHPFRQFVSSYFQTSNSTMKIHPLA